MCIRDSQVSRVRGMMEKLAMLPGLHSSPLFPPIRPQRVGRVMKHPVYAQRRSSWPRPHWW
eukprot:9474831-Prorocentrum_lima.AAC.1